MKVFASRSFTPQRDINDMNFFIRFDKLENYSCDGTAVGSFCVFLRFPSSRLQLEPFFVRLGKLKNLFLILYYLQPLPVFCFLFVIAQTNVKNPWGWNRKINLSTFLLLCTSCCSRRCAFVGGEMKRTKSFSLTFCSLFKWIWQ